MNNEYIYCGFWRRFGARIIDGFLSFGFSFLVSYTITLIVIEKPIAQAAYFEDPIYQFLPLIMGLIVALIIAIFNCSKIQGTPGKYWLGIKIITKGGERISFLRSLARILSPLIISIIVATVFTILSYFLLSSSKIILLGVISCIITISLTDIISALLVIFTKEKTALHDLIAGTRVVRR